jgi:hypothetical protein
VQRAQNVGPGTDSTCRLPLHLPQEVSEKMDAQAAERSRQLAENEELRGKLDTFLAQFESFNTLVGGRRGDVGGGLIVKELREWWMDDQRPGVRAQGLRS